ncbi:MAG: capsular polysaccharide biosynthesis protein [Pseudomonadota bacterium]
MLDLANFQVTTGWPSGEAEVGVWGRKPVSRRGRWIADRTGADLITIEDGFLHSIGQGSGASASLVLDDVGIYFEGRAPSGLEYLLEEGSPVQSAESRRLINLICTRRLSKYTPPNPAKAPEGPYILVVDQTRGDASIAGADATADTFRQMLDAARTENPDGRILVKTHPEVATGRKQGYLSNATLDQDEECLSAPVNPWDVLVNATAVYTVSSQLGYEALLAGCKVRCFGKAFYAGWGLTDDEQPIPRRTRTLTIEELFTACHLEYPIYYDPWRDALCDLETACDVLHHQRLAQSDDDGAGGDVFAGARLWKRGNLRQFRPGRLAPRFADSAGEATAKARSENRRVWLWGAKYETDAAINLNKSGVPTGMVEDGFLRSVGLGAELTQAASLVFDRQGIYFDPNHPSDLEDHVRNAASGRADLARAAALRHSLVTAGVTKYNLSAQQMPPPPAGKHVVLVPGQVEDDASIQRGCGTVRTNLGLLRAAREANPEAWVIYKPHPDVEAGLRAGKVSDAEAKALADAVAERAAVPALLNACDALWTMTSLMGFEALLRGKPVTCLGTPFYAGWGLTTDLGPPCPRRDARPSLDELVWAALIEYPSYVDPVSGLPCPPELVVDRLAAGTPGRKAGVLSRLQGLLATQSWLWRS